MDESLGDNESLITRIQQLEHERDELRKDIEQLCMQQAGPSYLAVATRMHFQRTAGLEQEIENLKKKLAASTGETANLKEELSEAYRIKGQLAALHDAEVSKNTEAQARLKFLQGVVANAFAERDQAIMEAEKAKEKEELISQKLNDFQKRFEGLSAESVKRQELIDSLQIKLDKQEQDAEAFKKVINKFYKIRLHTVRNCEDEDNCWDENCTDSYWVDKCACLLQDPVEAWSFDVCRDPSAAKYITALQEQLENLRCEVDDRENKIQVGLRIESHLKRKVRELEARGILLEKLIKEGISKLRRYHLEQRIYVMNLLDEGRFYLRSLVDDLDQKLRPLSVKQGGLPQGDNEPMENDGQSVHTDNAATLVAEVNGACVPNVAETVDSSEALSQAVQDKVSTLLLLSQQEERYSLERNVLTKLQEKIDELQKTIVQVTNEKVEALMELAQMKQDYQLLQEKVTVDSRQRNLFNNHNERSIIVSGREGKFKNLLKKTSLKRWLGTSEFHGNEAGPFFSGDGSFISRQSSRSIDDARLLQIENATLKESIHSVERLTSEIRRLRLSLISLMKANEAVSTSGTPTIDEIIMEAKLVKTALGSALPLSWAGEGDIAPSDEIVEEIDNKISSKTEKIDAVSAAGFEMVELLLLSARIMKDLAIKLQNSG